MNQQLIDCPICKKSARIGYACGDYFVYCSDGCISPMCDHPAVDDTIEEWHCWANNVSRSMARKIIWKIRARIRRFQFKHRIGPYQNHRYRMTKSWKQIVRSLRTKKGYVLLPDWHKIYHSWIHMRIIK